MLNIAKVLCLTLIALTTGCALLASHYRARSPESAADLSAGSHAYSRSDSLRVAAIDNWPVRDDQVEIDSGLRRLRVRCEYWYSYRNWLGTEYQERRQNVTLVEVKIEPAGKYHVARDWSPDGRCKPGIQEDGGHGPLLGTVVEESDELDMGWWLTH